MYRLAYHQAAVAIFSRTALELRQLAKVLVGQRDSMRVEQLATATLVLAFSATMILMASFFSAKRSIAQDVVVGKPGMTASYRRGYPTSF